MVGVFGNQSFNPPPSMKSYGGIYASESYSTFHAPATVTFRSGKSEALEALLKGGAKWSDEAAVLITRGLDPSDFRIFAKEMGITKVGSDVLADVSDDALRQAVEGSLKNSGPTKLKGVLASMSNSGQESLENVAKKITSNLQGAGVADEVIGATTVKKILGSADEVGVVGAKPVGDTVVEGTGKTWDELVEEGAESAEGKATLRTALVGTNGEGGAIRNITAKSGGAGKLAGGLLLVSATVAPQLTGTVLGVIFTNIGSTISTAAGGVLGGDGGGGGLTTPDCPDVGKPCDENTTLQAGCICVDDDGDGQGTIDQQGFKLNANGYIFLGVVGVVGLGLITMILR